MERGEIYSLGVHRLMCGDATKREDVEHLIDGQKVDLVLTDPPYGMKAQLKNGKIGDGGTLGGRLNGSNVAVGAKKYPMLIGDENQDTARASYEVTKNICEKQIIFGGQYFAHFLPISGGWLFWDKQRGTLNFSDGELAWRSWGKKVCKYEHRWNGLLRAGSQKLNGKTRIHPTQKPVELFANILEDFTKPDDVVLDCFGGSGTTLIACEVTGRKCLMMELSPDYCEIIVDRYREISGLFVEVKK